MIKYFKELEDRDNFYLKLIKYNYNFKNNYQLYPPLDFFVKYKELFTKLKEFDVLYNKDNDRKIIFEGDAAYLLDPEYIIDILINHYYNEMDLDIDLSSDIKDLFDVLTHQFKINYNGDSWYKTDHYEIYFTSILRLLELNDKVIVNKSQIYDYINSTMIAAKYQKKLSKEDEELILKALDEFKDYKISFEYKPFKAVDVNIDGCWFITPYKHLYNSIGADAHKQSNLLYPYYDLMKYDRFYNPIHILEKIKNIDKNSYIDYTMYSDLLHFSYDFPSIRPEEYYNMSDRDQFFYDRTDKRSYNPKLVLIIKGILSAHAGFSSFFYELGKYAKNYKEEVDKILEMDFDEILVRCCGFHKIGCTGFDENDSNLKRTIVTSCINYEEEFSEYIKKGWNIQFIPPIIINKEKGIIEEYPKDFLTIRKVLKNC